MPNDLVEAPAQPLREIFFTSASTTPIEYSNWTTANLQPSKCVATASWERLERGIRKKQKLYPGMLMALLESWRGIYGTSA